MARIAGVDLPRPEEEVGVEEDRPGEEEPGRRVGDLDVFAALFVMKQRHLDPDAMAALLASKSGLAGISGVSGDVRDLRGVLDREKAAIGLLITLQPPTRPMEVEAASIGFYEHKLTHQKYPRLQLRTVKELMAGKAIERPSTVAATDETLTIRPWCCRFMIGATARIATKGEVRLYSRMYRNASGSSVLGSSGTSKTTRGTRGSRPAPRDARCAGG